MMDIKVSLNIVLPGAVMFAKQECLKQLTNYVTTKSGKKIIGSVKTVEDSDKLDFHSMTVEDSKTKKSERISFSTRKSRPASQQLNISKVAYEYMISSEMPSWFENPKLWSQFSKKQRLEAHLKRTTLHLNGVSFTYEVMPD